MENKSSVRLTPETPIARAFLLMQSRELNMVPVVDHNELVGWLTRDQMPATLTSHGKKVADYMTKVPTEKALRIAVVSAKAYDKKFFVEANKSFGFQIEFFEHRLEPATVSLCDGFDVVCAFVNDDLSARTLSELAKRHIKHVVLRCAGYNNVDLEAAKRLEISIQRVPAYSPHAVSEHALALLMTLARKTHRAYNRVREGNFELDGLIGTEIHGKTVGVVGTGKIGAIFAETMIRGFGCKVLAFDPSPNPAVTASGATYCDLKKLYAESDIISLHCPLTPDSRHMVNETALAQMRDGVILINTSRGGLIDTPALVDALKARKIGALGLDVYEEEEHLFFADHSSHIIDDDVFSRLQTFPNVLVTGHQAFLTSKALEQIAQVTLGNVQQISENVGATTQPSLSNELTGMGNLQKTSS